MYSDSLAESEVEARSLDFQFPLLATRQHRLTVVMTSGLYTRLLGRQGLDFWWLYLSLSVLGTYLAPITIVLEHLSF